MPELPDVAVYVESLERHVGGAVLEEARLFNPFLLRSVAPPLAAVRGRRVRGARRIGKRIAIGLEGGLFLVIHLMIAGRLRWRRPGAKPPGKQGLAAFDFADGTLMLIEAASKKRASLHVVDGEAALAEHDAGGIEPLECDLASFADRLGAENHTLKRALTDPRLFSGIGNAYSDEILHRARLSPMKMSRKLTGAEIERLHAATRETLTGWIERLRAEVGAGFPDKVTAFHDAMAVHGRYRQPCPDCGSPVQRIAYAENECNYCATCQNEGRLLADRSLSRLLKKDWPKTLDALEKKRASLKPR
ncbi:MAG: formamidopyrimidine-DNA glycosylase [Alphaproteobacteria bacterium]|nr:formamidopyrimidine-DNA glycosylase [Alphaproteobacteria bacterium]